MWFYNDFTMSQWLLMVAKYLKPNVPVVLPASMTEAWPARARYDAGGHVHWQALSEDYGEHTVPVIIGGDERKEMKLKEALSLIESETRPIYIKDWHLVRDEQWSFTPLHRDGFPERRTSELASTFDDMERRYAQGELGPFQDGKQGWPGWRLVRTRMYVVDQELNHNWCNSVNLTSMYTSMEEETDDVAAALSDVRGMMQGQRGWEAEFAALVQQVVQQDAGWAWEGFWRMVHHNVTQPSCDAWYEQQYLYSELLLRPEEETEFRPLHVYLAEVGDVTKPFLVPPRRFARQRAPLSKPASAVGSPLVSASNSPRPAAAAVHAEPTPVLPAPVQPGSASSNVSADDIATTMRVMTQLQSALQVAATDAQSAQIIQSVLASSLPHANAAGLQAILSAMQAQAAADAASASHAQERLDTHAAPSTVASDTPNAAPNASPLSSTEPTPAAPPVVTDSAPSSNEQDDTSTRNVTDLPTEQVSSTDTKKSSRKDRKVLDETPKNDEEPAVPTPEPEASAPKAETPQKTTEADSLPAPEAKAPAAKPKPAPWANIPAQSSASSTPSMRDILEAEQRERSAQDVKIRAANSAALAKAMAQMQVSSTPAAPSRPAGAAWSMPKATPAKSLSQIQAEESAHAAKEKASQAARPSAYSSSAARAPAETGWVKVVSHGKSAPASKSAPAAKPAAAPAAVPSRPPALSSVPFSSYVAPPVSAPAPAPVDQDEDGWVTKKSKHQVRRDALSQMNDAIPRPTGTAAGVAPRRVSGPSNTPQPPSAEFLQYCRTQLKGLRANVDDFIEMLLSFPLNPSPEVHVIIAEAVYANSSTLNGRQFAADFVARRKADAYRAVTL
ncbi:hypothetical protein MCAP1_000490 [Malassezia caprae]|uniref:Uncharacterized protein n=1 Tax=Malassezia caprae TaxID=1381934 RepID=A0AAF0IU19_9BASI|nr:hypothetical protein MCAP1_000490 [Malassezia caprae]